jgi:Tfp pilus assembly protein FimV
MVAQGLATRASRSSHEHIARDPRVVTRTGWLGPRLGQDDATGAQAVAEGSLVRHAAGNEEPARAVALEKRADPAEIPRWLKSVRGFDLDDPARVIGEGGQLPVRWLWAEAA